MWVKIINIDEKYVLYPDSVKTFDHLPARCYTVSFNKMSGFSLVGHDPLEVNEKIYGEHEAKAEKVLAAFKRSNRSIGAIASGKKGISKSVLFRLLANKCIETGIPVIIVDCYIPGIAGYIESISQEVMVLFDEFDKTFAGVKDMEGAANAQTELLGLFDGTSSGKKLFAITCNDINRISEFLVNRPGRFHYHFRFETPSIDEVKAYLHDKLNGSDEEWLQRQIDEIVKFSRKVPLNYDCLRSIVFELESGSEFKDAIKDLNILKMNDSRYNITLHYKTGEKMSARNNSIDMFDSEEVRVWVDSEFDCGAFVQVIFDTSDAVFDTFTGEYRLDEGHFRIRYDDDCYEPKVLESFKKKTPDKVTIKLAMDKTYNYLV